MKKIIQIFSIFGIMLSISVICNSCKTASKESTLSSAASACTCDDMGCWRTRTEEGQQRAFSCAYASLSEAVKSGVKYAEAMKEISDIVAGLYRVTIEVADNLTEFDSKGNPTPEALENILNAATQELSAISKQPPLICANSIKPVLDLWNNSFKGIIESSREYVIALNTYGKVTAGPMGAWYAILNNKQTLFLKSITNFIKSLITTASKLDTISSCFQAIGDEAYDKNPKSKLTILKSIGENFEKIAKLFTILGILQKCQYVFTEDSVALLANTQCMMEDLANVYFPHTPSIDYIIANPNCTQECPATLLRVYATKAQEQFNFIDASFDFVGKNTTIGTILFNKYIFEPTRSTRKAVYCSNACLNENNRIKECKNTVKQLYKDKQYYNICLDSCETDCSTAINRCVEACCKGECDNKVLQ